MKFLNMGGRIRSFRERKELSLADLAKRVEVKPSELELIEENKEVPSIGVLIRLSKNLGINVADIFRERPEKKAFEIIKASEKLSVTGNENEEIRDCGYHFSPLTYPSADKHLDAYLVEVPEGQERSVQKKVTHPGEEFIYILDGQINGEIAGEPFELHVGDSLYLRSTNPHLIYNPGKILARALIVVYPY